MALLTLRGASLGLTLRGEPLGLTLRRASLGLTPRGAVDLTNGRGNLFLPSHARGTNRQQLTGMFRVRFSCR